MKKPQNYYFEVIPPERAKTLFRENKEVFKMFDDSESLVESEHDLHDAIDLGIELATENPIG